MKQLYYDVIGGRYFESTADDLSKAMITIDNLTIKNGRMSLNDLYEELGLEPISIGDGLVWVNEPMIIHPEFLVRVEDHRSCIAINFMNLQSIYNELWC